MLYKMIKKAFPQDRHTPIILGAFFILAAIFVYLRFQPIGLKTVPYTYDQGRDFLAARDIVINKDLTLIGPTTGAGGVFHGAGWYYFLAIPFIFGGGSPTAFYYFIAISALLQAILFSHFLYKKTHPMIALLFMAIVAMSPYFIRTSIFAISSIMTLPFILLLMFSVYQYVDTKKLSYLALFGLSTGMILEGEVAFGLLLIPAIVLTLFLIRQVKLFLGSVKKLVHLAVGFGIAESFRLLFELKYNFMQTRSLIAFRNTPGTHYMSFKSAFFERIDLFKGYYADIYHNSLDGFGWIVLLVACSGIYYGYKKYSEGERIFVQFTSVLIGLLLFFSALYHKNAFWPYYYEGIHYFFLGLVMFGFLGLYKAKKELALKLCAAFVLLFLISGAHLVYQKIAHPDKVQNEGLRLHMDTIDYIHKQVGSKPYCLRIYTPPVITHTYSYLLDLHARTQGMTYPRTVFYKHECWYIIEHDENNERLDAWLKGNIPAEGKKLLQHRMSKDVVIEKWLYPSP